MSTSLTQLQLLMPKLLDLSKSTKQKKTAEAVFNINNFDAF